MFNVLYKLFIKFCFRFLRFYEVDGALYSVDGAAIHGKAFNVDGAAIDGRDFNVDGDGLIWRFY